MFRCFGGWGVIPNPQYERSEMYILDVKTPNKLLTHKGRSVRTPAIFTITKAEIKMFEVMLRQVGAEEYSVRSKDEVDKELALQKEFIPIKEIQEEVIIEEILDDEDETRSVLDQLVKDAEKEK
jgi:hypothetical protein